MRVRCDYGGNYIEDTDKNCPHCGAPNDRMQRSGTKVPKTIEELKAFCAAHHLPLEQMRFFLGEDYRGPRAFGVYKDGEGNFVLSDDAAAAQDRAVFTIRLTLVDGRVFTLAFYPYSDGRYLLSFKDAAAGIVSREF